MDSYIVKVQHENSLRRLTFSSGDELTFSYGQLVSKARDIFQFPPTTELVLTYVDKEGDVVTMADDQDVKDALVLQSLNPLRLTLQIVNRIDSTATDVKVDSSAEPEKRQPQDSNSEMLQKVENSRSAQRGQGTTDVNEKSTSNAVAPATENKGGPGVPDASKNDEAEHVLHSGIECDGCGMTPIAGPRFKSNKKANYDLCRSCFEAPGVDADDFFKIDSLFPLFGHPFMGRLAPAFSCRTTNSCPPTAAGVDSDRCSRRCAPVSAEKPGADAKEVVHNGVTCDGCRSGPIVGPRFKSTTKFDFDLCLSCFEKSRGSDTQSDEYLRMDEPANVAYIHPLMLHRLARFASPYGPMCGRRGVWIMNPIIRNEPVGQSATGVKSTAPTADAQKNRVDPAVQSDTKNSSAANETTPATEAGEFKQLSELEGEAVQVPQVDVKVEEGTGPKVDSAAAEKPAMPEDLGPVNKSAEDDLATFDGLLAKLGAMGFIDQKLNEELLKKNKLDLRTTLDDLCASEEWDPILEELQEMGFYDSDLNRRLMFKNGGSVKRVVKELVQLSKVSSSKSGKEIKTE